MKTWPKVKLGDICAINPKVQSPDVDSLISVVPMSAVSETGEIDASAVQPFGDVSKGLTLFQEGDVLFAKITPCMENGKGAVAVGLRGGIGAGSTEFFVLRPDSKRVTSAWIYHFTKREAFRRLAAERMTGSGGQRRVPRVFLESVTLPIPPLAEQERIAAELDAVAATLKKRQTQLAELNVLVEARFIELFGDPATNPKGWPVKILKDCLAEIQSGNREKGGALASGVPSLGAEHINNDGGFNLQPEKLKYIGEEFYCNLKRGKIQIGDVLLVKDGATTGKTGYVTSSFPFEKAAVNEHVFLLRSKPGMTNLFLFYYLRSKVGKERVLGKFHGATIGGITKDFALIEIPLPPLELQERFAAEVERVEALKTTVRDGIAETQTLFDALTQRYFG